MKPTTLPALFLVAGLALAPARAEGLLGTGAGPEAWAPHSEEVLDAELARVEALEAESGGAASNRVVAHLVGLAFSKLSVLALPAMRTLNRSRPTSVLTDDAKARLRPVFGDMVDRVNVVYRAQLLDAETIRAQLGDGWLVRKLKEYGVFDRITLVERAAGMTIGDWVFVTGEPGAEGQVHLMAHELVHVRQYEQAGSLSAAAYNYGYAFVMCGWNYYDHPSEAEARRVAESLDA